MVGVGRIYEGGGEWGLKERAIIIAQYRHNDDDDMTVMMMIMTATR